MHTRTHAGRPVCGGRGGCGAESRSGAGRHQKGGGHSLCGRVQPRVPVVLRGRRALVTALVTAAAVVTERHVAENRERGTLRRCLDRASSLVLHRAEHKHTCGPRAAGRGRLVRRDRTACLKLAAPRRGRCPRPALYASSVWASGQAVCHADGRQACPVLSTRLRRGTAFLDPLGPCLVRGSF